jgi:hypothetical protein
MPAGAEWRQGSGESIQNGELAHRKRVETRDGRLTGFAAF